MTTKRTIFSRSCLAGLFSFVLILSNGQTRAFAHDGEPHDGNDLASTDVTGDLTVIQADDFENHRAQIFYLLQDSAQGKTFYLRFENVPPQALHTGDKIKVRGHVQGDEIVVPANGQNVQTVEAAAAAVTGVQNTIVMLINFLDANLECSQAAVTSLMFGSTSVDKLYQETSYGNVSLSGLVVGPYLVNYYSTNTCDYNGWASAAESAAQAGGVNLSQYSRRIYVFPKKNPCGWAGLGTIGGNPSRAWIAYCDLPDVYAHEFGHNVTMHHSSTPGCEYCDTSDFMGYGGVGWRQVNAPHKEQMGWLPASKIVTATGNMTIDIAPLELYPGVTALPQTLKIAKPDTAEYYYFSFRRKLGFDSALSSTYADRANVHRYKGSGAIQTFFLGGLSDGGSFSDPANGFSVTQVLATNDYVRLQVSFGCAPAASTLTMSPSVQGGQPGATLNYAVQLANNDSAFCGAATFYVAPTAAAGLSASAPSYVTLNPGQSTTLTLAFTSSAGASPGSYEVGVNVTDSLEPLHNKSATATYVVDTAPPTAPKNLAGSYKTGKVQLTWTGSTDNVALKMYCVWRNGVKIGTPATTSFQDASVSVGNTYAYFVTAMDGANNESGPSNTASVTVSNKGGGKPR